MPTKYHTYHIHFLWISLAIIFFDQFTKSLALFYLSFGQPFVVLPILNFTLLYNTGAAFRLFDSGWGWQQWLFGSLAIVISGVLFRWLLMLPKQERWNALGIALIIGGALSNLCDRLFRGQVIDFLSFHYQHWYFAVFNVADSAICMGAFFLILQSLLVKARN